MLSGVRRLMSPSLWLPRTTLITLTVMQALVGFAWSRVGLRFDGAFDVHRTWASSAPVPITHALIDQLAALVVTSVVVVVAMRLIGATLMWRDAFMLVGVARVPLVASAPLVLLLHLPPEVGRVTSGMPAIPSVLELAMIAALIVSLCWTIAILVGGIRHASHAQGWRLAGLTLMIVVIAEFVSKVLVSAAR